MWLDPSLFFLVDHRESYAKTWQHETGPAYFAALGFPDFMDLLDQSIYHKGKGVKPDVAKHPGTQLFPKQLPLKGWEQVCVVSETEDRALSGRLSGYWSTAIPKCMPRPMMHVMPDGAHYEQDLGGGGAASGKKRSRAHTSGEPLTFKTGTSGDKKRSRVGFAALKSSTDPAVVSALALLGEAADAENADMASVNATSTSLTTTDGQTTAGASPAATTAASSPDTLAITDETAATAVASAPDQVQEAADDTEDVAAFYEKMERVRPASDVYTEAAKEMLEWVQAQPYGNGVTGYTDLKPFTSSFRRAGMRGFVHGFTVCFSGLYYCEYAQRNHSADTKVYFYCNLETRKFHQQCQSEKCNQTYDLFVAAQERAKSKGNKFQGVHYHSLPSTVVVVQPELVQAAYQNPFQPRSLPSAVTAADTAASATSFPVVAVADATSASDEEMWAALDAVVPTQTAPAAAATSNQDAMAVAPVAKNDNAGNHPRESDDNDAYKPVSYAAAMNLDDCPDYEEEVAFDDLPENDRSDTQDIPVEWEEGPSGTAKSSVVIATPKTPTPTTAVAVAATAVPTAQSTWENLPPDEKWNQWLESIRPQPTNGTPPLSSSQAVNPMYACFDAIVHKRLNCVLTGAAGCGKTTTWEGILYHLHKVHPHMVVLELASYGVAAGQLMGFTIQKWANTNIETFLSQKRFLQKLHELWHQVRTEQFPQKSVHPSAASYHSVRDLKRMGSLAHEPANASSSSSSSGVNTGLYPYRLELAQTGERAKRSASFASIVAPVAAAASNSLPQRGGEMRPTMFPESAASAASKRTPADIEYQTRVAYVMDLHRPLLRRWQYIDMLVLGEFSPIDPSLFEFLDQTARIGRGCNKPFGGVQVVMHGDKKQRHPILPPNYPSHFPRTVWATKLWTDTFGPEGKAASPTSPVTATTTSTPPQVGVHVELLQSQRQANDLRFFHFLERLSIGKLRPDDLHFLNPCLKPFSPPRARVIALFPFKTQVWAMNDITSGVPVKSRNGVSTTASNGGSGGSNNTKIARVGSQSATSGGGAAAGEWFEYPSTIMLEGTHGSAPQPIEWTDDLRDQLDITPLVRVRVGSPFMYRANVNPSKQIYNGKLGEIVDFSAPTAMFDRHASTVRYPILYFPPNVESPLDDKSARTYVQYYITQTRNVKINGKRVNVSVRYMPFDLGFATTIAKSQGLTLPAISIQVDSSLRTYSNLHIALSRVRKLSDVYITKFDPSVLRAWIDPHATRPQSGGTHTLVRKE
jgi:hypothetical protein